MMQGLVAAGVILVLAMLVLLVWLIASNLATRRDMAGQAAGLLPRLAES